MVVLSKPPKYTDLQNAAKQFMRTETYKLSYIDEDGDRITLSSQYDLDTAFTFVPAGKHLRLIAELPSHKPLPLPPTALVLTGTKTTTVPSGDAQSKDGNDNSDGKEKKKESVQYRALYSFSGEQPGDLAFKKGDIIEVTKQDSSWWDGECNGKSGAFPCNYVSPV